MTTMAPVAELTVDRKLCSEAKQGPGGEAVTCEVFAGESLCWCFVQVIQSKYLEKDMMMLDTL